MVKRPFAAARLFAGRFLTSASAAVDRAVTAKAEDLGHQVSTWQKISPVKDPLA